MTAKAHEQAMNSQSVAAAPSWSESFTMTVFHHKNFTRAVNHTDPLHLGQRAYTQISTTYIPHGLEYHVEECNVSNRRLEY